MPAYEEVQPSVQESIETNTEKYKTSPFDPRLNVYQYPEGLGANDDLRQFVLFNINVRGKSKFNQDQRLEAVRREDSANLTEDQLGSAAAVTGTLAGAAAGAGIANLATNYAGKFNKKQTTTGVKPVGGGGIVDKGIKAGGAVLGAGAGYALTKSDMLKPDVSYRIKDSIALYINDPPTVRYNAQYSNKDLGTLAGLAGSISSVDSLKSAMSAGGEAAAALALQFAKVPSALGIGSPAEILGASAKVAMNPFKEVLFESIDFRSFSFKYRFLPKSYPESQHIKKIVDTFKFHMHPELSTNKLFFIYPSEFQIAYYYQSDLNNYFHQFKPCVLESMDVTYGGDTYSSFNGGFPTEVNLSLTFRETEILTKDQIAKGF